MEIIVVGYPKSGNTWLCRLLGSILDSPQVGIHSATPLCTWEHGRKGEHIIRQLHLQPHYGDLCEEVIPTAYRLCVDKMKSVENKPKILHVYRDPRDVTTSVMNYWNRVDVKTSLDIVVDAKHPADNTEVWGLGTWKNFVNAWFECDVVTAHVRYEGLVMDTYHNILSVLLKLGLTNIDTKIIERSIVDESFDNRRKHIEKHGAMYSYNRNVQLTAMWKGKIGTWKEFFSKEDAKRLNDSCGDLLKSLGYEQDDSWIDEVQE